MLIFIMFWLVLPVFAWLGAIVIAAASGNPGLIGDQPSMRAVVIEQFLVAGFCLGNTPWVAAWLHIDFVKLFWAVLVFCGVHLAIRMILSITRRNRGPAA